MDALAERGIWLPAANGAGHRRDLATFVDRARRLDDVAVIRLRTRPGGQLTAWVGTGLDVLAGRVVAGSLRPDDLCVSARELAEQLAGISGSGNVHPGSSRDAAWRGALPPESGFTHLDDVPVQVMLDLAQRGARLVKEHGSSAGLLDQEVIRVSAAETSVGIPLRCVFALTAMGFAPQSNDAVGEMVRVRIMPAWLRVDARFGSVYRRRGDPGLVLR